jgi:hypothetical protein
VFNIRLAKWETVSEAPEACASAAAAAMEAFPSEHKQLEGFGFEDFLSDPNHPMVLNTTNDYVFWFYGNETLSMYEFYTVSALRFKLHLQAPGLPWAEVTHVMVHCGQYS